MRAYSIFSIPDGLTDDQRQRRRHMLARTGLAWLGMMQIMMFAFPGYLRHTQMGEENAALLEQAIYWMNWLGLVLCIPVITYCAWPVWKGAWASVSRGRVGMDVPVALGIVVAFIPSVRVTFGVPGEVYYDSVSMFVAFLLTARYLELCARQSVTINGAHHLIEEFRQALTARADRLAFWFVVIQLALAFIVTAFWYVYYPEHALAVMVAMFVMSCPCAMAMAAPTAVSAAHARLSVSETKNEFEVTQLIQETGEIARQNLYGSIAWHLLMTPLAAIGLVAPWVAAISMLISSLAVALNSWRLYRRVHRRAPVSMPVSAAQG